MNTSTLDKQFASVAEGRSNLADIRTPHGKLVVLSERLGKRFRPLLEYMARQVAAESASSAESTWTDEKNARRVTLIQKKYADGLTATEKRELKALQQEGDRFVDQLIAPRNEMLELMLLGLEQKAAQQKTPQ